MASSENKTARTLADLGATQPSQISVLFLEARARFDSDSLSARDEPSWKQFRDAWLGRKSGVLTQITDNWLKMAAPELKRVVGASLNELRAHVESQIEERHKAIEGRAAETALARERFDLSLPGVIRPLGSHHLIRQVFQQIEDIFFSIGFSVMEGPEIETPYYNFEALNIPEHHPARDTMDTFYLDLPATAGGPPGAPSLLLRENQRGFRSVKLCVGCADLRLLNGDLRVDVLDARLRLLNCRLGLTDSYRIVGGVDHHQKIALVNVSVIHHVQFDNATGDFGRHRDYIRSHGGVAGPR